MRATYALVLQSNNSERDSIPGLRAVLKLAKRRGLRAVYVRELPSTDQQTIRRRDAQRRIANTTQRRNRRLKMANAMKYAGSTYIKLDDVHDKPPLRERISFVKEETGKFGDRLVAFFESGRKLSLNATSVGILCRDIDQDTDHWTGRNLEVFAGEVDTKSGRTDAVLVRVLDGETPPADPPKAPPKKMSAGRAGRDMDDEIPF
jgi:hypothetical protein